MAKAPAVEALAAIGVNVALVKGALAVEFALSRILQRPDMQRRFVAR